MGRKNHLNGGAASVPAEDAELTLVKLYGSLRDRKSHAEASRLRTACLVDPVEGPENRLPL